jgi:mRNA interferase MazF
MALQRGDVVLVPFPFSDQSATKVRPAVLVSSDDYGQNEPDIILAALTTQIASATGPFDYTLVEWQQAGLRFASAFKPVFTTLDPALVVYKVGTLTTVDLAQVDARLRLIFDL